MLAGLLAGCPIGVSIFSEDMERRLYANPKLAEIFGAETPEQLLVSNIEDSWCDADRLTQMKAFLRSGQELENFVAKRRRLDGSIFWVILNSQLAEVDGRMARLIWATEVTDLVSALKETSAGAQTRSA